MSEEEGEINEPKKQKTMDLDKLSMLASGSESGKESDDDTLKQLEDFYGADTIKGKDIDGKLAKIVVNGLCQGINEEKIKEVTDSYIAPGNCKNLVMPRTNLDIWKKISPRCRDR